MARLLCTRPGLALSHYLVLTHQSCLPKSRHPLTCGFRPRHPGPTSPWRDSNPRPPWFVATRSGPLSYRGTSPLRESNPPPPVYETGALPSELKGQQLLCQSPGRDSNPRSPAYQAGALTSWPPRRYVKQGAGFEPASSGLQDQRLIPLDHPCNFCAKQSGWRDSNPRPLRWQRNALAY